MKKFNIFLLIAIFSLNVLGNNELPLPEAKNSLNSSPFFDVFIENKGQIPDDRVLFFSYIKGGLVFFKKNSVEFVFKRNKKVFRYGFEFNGKLVVDGKVETVFNFIKPHRRIFNVCAFKTLRVKGKDYSLKFYHKNGRLEYDIICQTNKGITFKYNLNGGKLITKENKLIIRWKDGMCVETIPFSMTSQGKPVRVQYKVKRNRVFFAGGKQNVVIDPSTYIGGSSDELLYSIKMRVDGSQKFFYFTGVTSSSDFPYNSSVGNTRDNDIVFGCFKDSPTSNPVFITVIGGSGDDRGFSLWYEQSQHAVFVAGFTTSSNFPVASNTPYQASKSTGEDGIILKFDENGNYLAMTYLGGNNNERIFCIDYVGFTTNPGVIVTGPTWSSNFPVTTGAYQTTYGGYCDAFISILDSDLSSLEKSTYLGGNSIEYPYTLHPYSLGTMLSYQDRILIAGTTYSRNFPTRNPIQSANAGGYDVFVTQFKGDLSDITFSTYIGGSSYDYAFSINGTKWISFPFDEFKLFFIGGETYSSDFPTTSNSIQSIYGGSGDGIFITLEEYNVDRFRLNLSTFVGGSKEDVIVPVDYFNGFFGNIVVAAGGYTKSSDFPVTQCGYNQNFNGETDLFVLLFGFNRNAFTGGFYSTLVGGSGTEEVNSLIITSFDDYPCGNGFSPNSKICVALAGWTNSNDFPDTDNQFQEILAGQKDMLITHVCLHSNCADLAIEKECLQSEAYPGDTVTYRISVVNNGVDKACAVILNDSFPDILQQAEYSLDGGISWQPWTGSFNIGDMENGQVFEILLRGQIPSDTPENTVVTNVATVESQSPVAFFSGTSDPDNSNNTAEAEFTVRCANYVIDVTVDNGTTPTPHTVVCNPHQCVTVYFYPEEGYHLGQLLIDGKPHCFCPGQTTYTFCNLDGDHEVHAIFVKEENPVITKFTATPKSGLKPLDVEFTCEAYDPDGGNITKFLWDFDGDGVVDRETLSGDTVQTVYPDNGVFWATVKVVDDEGQTTESHRLKIKVGKKNPICYSPGFLANCVNSSQGDYLCVINDNELDSNLTITYFDENGEILNQVPYLLKSFNKLCFASGNCSDNKVKVIRIEGDQELTYLWRVDSENDSAMFMPGKNPDNKIFLPHIAEEKIWSNVVGISNPYASKVYINDNFISSSLFVSEFVSDEKIVNLPSFWFEVEAPEPTPFEESNALSGFVCYERNDGKFSIVSDSEVFTHGYLAHIPTESSIFWYGYVLTNIDSKDVNIKLKFFNSRGEILGEKLLMVNQGEKYKGLLESDFPEFAGKACWIEIVSDGLISAESVYGAITTKNNGGGVCALSANAKAGTTLIFPEAFEDNFWTGISVVNISDSQALLTLKLIESDGTIVETRNVDLGAFSQFKDVLSSIFSRKTVNGYVVIESTQPIVGVMIKGNSDNSRMLGVTGKVY